MKFDIKHRYTDAILYSGEGETLAAVVTQAVRSRANLACANLAGANLADAYLADANLARANLARANLACANLADANLAGANLADAYLADAYLARANLACANLADANLAGANLAAPCVMIAAGDWGDLSDELTADLMLWDAANHPDPEAFDRWAKGGDCPYASVKVARAARFREKKHLWGKGQVCRPWDLWQRLLAEKCPPWSDEQVEAFKAKFKTTEPTNA